MTTDTTTSGGELIARMLKAEGVEVVFGIIDGSYFGLYSSLGDHGIKLVTPRHETTAAHMAGAYARLTGRLGVCIASNGPGVANVLPGVAVENGEGNRVLLISSWRRAPIVGPDRGGTYQYFDQAGVTAPMTKWSGTATSFERLPQAMRRAFRTSYEGRPGVVHVTVSEDVMNGSFENTAPLQEPSQYRRVEPLAPSADQVTEAVQLLTAARLPLIQVGTGVLHAGASSLVTELAQLLDCPVSASWGGRSALDSRLANVIPLLPPLVDEIRNEADVVLALGTRFGETDWWGKPPYWRVPEEQAVIQVDIDEHNIGVNKPVTIGSVADISVFLQAVLDELRAGNPSPHAEWRQSRMAEFAETKSGVKEFLHLLPNPPDEDPMHSAHVPIVCREVFDDDAILVIDGGNTAVWTNIYHENHEPGAVLSTNKFGMLGAGLGQALGAQVAYPDRQVYCIIGDGAFGFHPQEIETAVRNDLPIIFMVLADRQWGMVKFGQSMALNPEAMEQDRTIPESQTINTDFNEIRFDDLARSMGAHGERVATANDLSGAIKRSLDSGLCSVIHVDVDPVNHMWAPGLDIFKAMHAEPGE